jgi:hypothetical protein
MFNQGRLHSWRIYAATAVTVLWVCHLAGPLFAQTTPQVGFTNIYQPPPLFDNPNINARPLTSPPRFDPVDVDPYETFKERLSKEFGIDYLFAYTPLFQLGEGGREYIDAEVDFGFIWNLFDNGNSRGNLLTYMLWVQTYSTNPTGEFLQPYGVITQANSGGTDPNQGTTQLNLFAWEQTWLDEGVSVRFGQLRNDFFFGTNKYHNDDRYVFLHSVLSGLQGINWAATGKGIGGMIDVRGDRFYTTLGFADAKARQTYPEVQSFFDGRYHYLGEIGWTPTFGCNSEGEYKATMSYTARTGDPSNVSEREGYGLILGARQDFNKRFGVAARWNKSFERFNAGLRESLAASCTMTGVGRYKDDWISLGFFYGKPTDRALQEESGMEIYWRAQLTNTIELTPDFLMYFDRARESGPTYFGAFRIRILL